MNITKWIQERTDTNGNINAEEVLGLFKDIKSELGSVLEFDEEVILEKGAESQPKLTRLEAGVYCEIEHGVISRELDDLLALTEYPLECFLSMHLGDHANDNWKYLRFFDRVSVGDDLSDAIGHKQIPYEDFLRLLKKNN